MLKDTKEINSQSHSTSFITHQPCSIWYSELKSISWIDSKYFMALKKNSFLNFCVFIYYTFSLNLKGRERKPFMYCFIPQVPQQPGLCRMKGEDQSRPPT